MIEIVIGGADPATRRLWQTVGELAARLPGGWVLIGGLMVQLHAIEHGMIDVRPTMDIDVLGQARPPGALAAIDAALRHDGFDLCDPDLDGYGYRYERGGIVVDVLAPEGIKPPPALRSGVTAVGVPGGTQALGRSETVLLHVGEHSFELRRPTLLGAILIMARSLMVHADRASQREDLLRLLSLVDEPRELAAKLRESERRWLQQAQARLDFSTVSSLSTDVQRRAELAYRLLARSPAGGGHSGSVGRRQPSRDFERPQRREGGPGRGPLER